MKKRLLAGIISALVISTSMLAGCGCENKTATDDETTTSVSETHEVSAAANTTIPTLSKEEKAIVDAGLKVDDKGNVVDKNGKKVEVKNGKVEVKTEDGKTMTVNVSEVSTASKNNSKINTSTSSKSNSTSSKRSSTVSSSSKSSSSSKTSSSSTSSKSSSSSSSKTSSSGSSSKTESSKVETHTHTWVNITKQVKIIDQEAYSYEEDVYETKGRTFCNVCGADITDNCAAHMKAHALADEGGGYHDEWVDVKVGTKTVNVPEKSHYETQTIGHKCSSCGKAEYY